jgi:hypothetical protein
MAEYFFVLDAARFERQLRPALADAWRARSFGPMRELCSSLQSAVRDFTERYHIGGGEALVGRIASERVAFDRMLWRTLVSELLLYSAVEIPEFQVNADTLTCLLAPDRCAAPDLERSQYAPIQQALLGSRDLVFGAAIYRPEHAGFNDAGDVVRLAGFLGSVRTVDWTSTDLAPLPDLPVEDRDDELEFAREWFPELAALYSRAADAGRAIVHESIF